MYPDPFNVRLIHDRMIAETLERHGPDHLLRERARWPLPSIGLHRLISLRLSRFVDWRRLTPRAGHTTCLCIPGGGTLPAVRRSSASDAHPTCR